MKAKSWQLWLCRIKRFVSLAFGPRVVWGWVDCEGEWRPNSRVSNCTAFYSRTKLYVEDHVFIGHFTVIDASSDLSIEEGCQISAYTGIFTHSSHAAIRLYGRSYAHSPHKKAYFAAPVSIGAFSYIGAHSTVMPGTKIGRGSIVRAYSLVKGEFPDFAILGGAPAVVLGDTRSMDEQLLMEHPELREHYEAWASPNTQPESP